MIYELKTSYEAKIDNLNQIISCLEKDIEDLKLII
jgi:exonuclease VII small subunit